MNTTLNVETAENSNIAGRDNNVTNVTIHVSNPNESPPNIHKLGKSLFRFKAFPMVVCVLTYIRQVDRGISVNYCRTLRTT